LAFGERAFGLDAVRDYVELFSLFYLHEAGGEAVRFGVDIEGVKGSGDTLGGQIGGLFGQGQEALHLVVVHQLAVIHPTFGTRCCTDPVPAAALADDFEVFSVFGVARDGRFQIDFAMQREDGRAGPGFPDSRGAFLLRCAATAEEQEAGEGSEKMTAGHL